MAENALAYVTRLSKAYVGYMETLSGALATELNAAATALKGYADRLALAAQTRAVSIAGERVNFKVEQAAAAEERAHQDAASWQTIQNGYARLNKDYACDLASAEETFWNGYTGAWIDSERDVWEADQGRIAAWQTYDPHSGQPDPDTIYNQECDDIYAARDDEHARVYYVKALDTITARDDRADAITKADYDYKVARYAHEKTWYDGVADAQADFATDQAEAGRVYAVAQAGAAGGMPSRSVGMLMHT